MGRLLGATEQHRLNGDYLPRTVKDKKLIQTIDPDAFIVVPDTTEVMGHRIGNQPHW
jgi:hypothetical protein